MSDSERARRSRRHAPEPQQAAEAELTSAGYAWEAGDASVLHDALTLVDLAHVLELDRLGAVPADARRRLLTALLDLVGTPATAIDYDPSHGEPYIAREQHLSRRIGDDVGWLRTGRTRREAMRTAFRMVARDGLLDVVAAAGQLATALSDAAARHVDTLMPDHTYLQQAQPTTFGHYVLSFADPVLREGDRLIAELPHVNSSPAGSGAANGSPVLVDRRTPGRALGFKGPVEHTRDAMWQVDPFLHLMAAATGLLLTQDSFAEDLEILASAEFGFVSLGEGHSRPSVLMPQKRNPYALTVVRGSAGIVIGRLTGQLSLAKRPSARSDGYIYLYGELPRALELASRVTRLSAGVIRDLIVHEDRMSAALDLGYTQAADLADLLSRRGGVDYRTAHRVVQKAVRTLSARGQGIEGLDVTLLADASAAVTGASWQLHPSELAGALDPRSLVRSRRNVGGTSGSAMRPMIRRIRQRSARLLSVAEKHREAFAAAGDDLVRHARRRTRTARPRTQSPSEGV